MAIFRSPTPILMDIFWAEHPSETAALPLQCRELSCRVEGIDPLGHGLGYPEIDMQPIPHLPCCSARGGWTQEQLLTDTATSPTEALGIRAGVDFVIFNHDAELFAPAPIPCPQQVEVCRVSTTRCLAVTLAENGATIFVLAHQP